jgi:hypothetical protein
VLCAVQFQRASYSPGQNEPTGHSSQPLGDAGGSAGLWYPGWQ